MSLQLLAKQLEAKGRGGDSLLVHMTPGEVAGLQKLAESAGGSLTINPDTGLVEANFLKKMLPTLVGAGLMMIPGVGLAAATAGGALVGGLQAKRNDQDVLTGALLGGLGAYGGAGLTSGLTAAGRQAAQAAAMGKEAGVQAAERAAEQGIQNAAAQQATLNAGQAEAANMLTTGADQSAQAAFNLQQPEIGARAIEQAGTKAGEEYMAQGAMDRLGGGLQSLTDTGSNVGRNAFTQQFGMKEAGMAAAPLMAPGKLEEPEKIKEDDEMIVYDYSPGRTGAERGSGTSAERQYFADDRFTNRRKVKAKDYFAAKGGLLSLAEGGDVAAPAALMGNGLGMSGASADAFNYLMGNTAVSPVTQSALAMQGAADNFVAPERERGGTISNLKGYSEIKEGPNKGLYQGSATYGFDPKSQQYYRTDKLFNYVAPEPEPVDPYGYQGGNAAGGLIGLAKGGMSSGGFVVPADVVSMVGEGNTDAGYRRIKAMIPGATAIKGKDGGQADTVKTHIDGKQPARVAHGEMYIPPATVKRMGGAKKLYAMMDRVRAQATGSTKQIRPVSLKKAMA